MAFGLAACEGPVDFGKPEGHQVSLKRDRWLRCSSFGDSPISVPGRKHVRILVQLPRQANGRGLGGRGNDAPFDLAEVRGLHTDAVSDLAQ